MPRGSRKDNKRRVTGTGLSLLGFGGNVQWELAETDKKVAQDVVTFLEDRRILYLPVNIEIVECSLSSVRELRGFLTEALQRTTPTSPLARNLRLIRSASRDFVTEIELLGQRDGGYDHWGWSRFDNPLGVIALGLWRGLVLANLAELVDIYDLAVDGPLATALPTIDDE